MPIEINGYTNSQSNIQKRSNAQDPVKSSTSGQSPGQSEDAVRKGETVSLSNKVQGLKQIENDIKSLPDVDQDKVARIKAAIADGSYQVDSKKLAQNMLNYEKSMF